MWKKNEENHKSDRPEKLSIMSITILNNQLDGSLASDTPVFQKILLFQSICLIFYHIFDHQCSVQVNMEKFQVQNFISDFRFEI